YKGGQHVSSKPPGADASFEHHGRGLGLSDIGAAFLGSRARDRLRVPKTWFLGPRMSGRAPSARYGTAAGPTGSCLKSFWPFVSAGEKDQAFRFLSGKLILFSC